MLTARVCGDLALTLFTTCHNDFLVRQDRTDARDGNIVDLVQASAQIT
ncbi:MAG: hypothetical protein MK077_10920 [Phycisphaerales bacterium]|nr:hypothetical protein [Phycisphaerales bacterium]